MGERKQPTPAPPTPSTTQRIRLGDRVRDRVTRVEGIVVAYTYWLFGCERISVQPEKTKDGKVPDNVGLDAAQCDVIKAGVITGYHPAPGVVDSRDLLARPAGPRQDATRPADPTR